MEPEKHRYAIAPSRAAQDQEWARPLFAALRWLESNQKEAGHWGNSGMLDMLICTCHASMAFLAAGYSPSYPAVSKGIAWLKRTAIAKHNNSYWRAAPLAGLVGEQALVNAELNKLYHAITGNASPNPDQLLEAHFIRVSIVTGAMDERIVECRKRLEERWARDDPWRQRADSVTDCYVALLQAKSSRAATIRPQVIKILRDTAHIDGAFVSWQNPISTAYTIMNVMETDLMRSEPIRDLIDKAVSWLLSLKSPDGNWESDDVPYGGTGDIKSNDFPTAAIVRSLVAFYDHEHGSVAQEIAALHRRQFADATKEARDARHRLRLAQWSSIAGFTAASLLAVALIITVFWNTISPYVPAVNSSWQWIYQNKEELATWSGVLGLIGLVAVFFKTLVRTVRSLYRTYLKR